MKYKILYKNYPIISAIVEEGERIKFSGTGVIGMSSNVRIGQGIDVSFKDGIIRMINGVAPYWQYLTSRKDKGHFLLSSGKPGSIVDLSLSGKLGLKVVKECFLACTEDVNIGVQYESMARKQFKGNKKLCTLTGEGIVFLSNFGEMHQINLKEDEEYFVDINSLVAFPDYMKYTIEKATNGWMSALTMREKVMICFQGPGSIIVQTCSNGSYRIWNTQLGIACQDDVDSSIGKVENKLNSRCRDIERDLSGLSNTVTANCESIRNIESRSVMNRVGSVNQNSINNPNASIPNAGVQEVNTDGSFNTSDTFTQQNMVSNASNGNQSRVSIYVDENDRRLF